MSRQRKQLIHSVRPPSCLLISDIFASIVVGVFLEPQLLFFGAIEQNTSYATTYISIINAGIPFLLFSTYQ